MSDMIRVGVPGKEKLPEATQPLYSAENFWLVLTGKADRRDYEEFFRWMAYELDGGFSPLLIHTGMEKYQDLIDLLLL